MRVRFEVLSDLVHVETIASGNGVRDRRRLIRQYGAGKAELHWYEAHGIGKKELKFKRPVSGR